MRPLLLSFLVLVSLALASCGGSGSQSGAPEDRDVDSETAVGTADQGLEVGEGSTVVGEQADSDTAEADISAVDDAGDQETDEEATQIFDNLVVTFASGRPVVSVYEASGELRHAVEFDAQSVSPFDRPIFGSRSVLLLDRGEQTANAIVLFDAATGASEELAQVDVKRGQRWVGQRSGHWHIQPGLVGELAWIAVNLATGQIVRPTDAAPGSSAYLSEDGSRLLYTRADGSAWQVETSALTEVRVPTGGLGVLPDLAPSPDGSRVAWAGSTDGVVRLTNVETSEIVPLDTVRLPEWINNDLLLGRTNDGHVLIDGRTGDLLSIVTGVSPDYAFVYVGSGFGVQEAEPELVTVVNFVSGEVTKHPVPGGTYFSVSPEQGGQVAWGTPGGSNGSAGRMAGWMLDVSAGSVATFEQLVSASAFVDPTVMAFTPDLTRAAVAVDGMLFQVDRDGAATAIADGVVSALALCRTGDVVARRDDGGVDLLSEGDGDVLATLEPARAALCLSDGPALPEPLGAAAVEVAQDDAADAAAVQVAQDDAADAADVTGVEDLLVGLPDGVVITTESGQVIPVSDGRWGAWCRWDVPGAEWRIDLMYGPASFIEEWEVGNKIATGFYDGEAPPVDINERRLANAALLREQGAASDGLLLPQPPQPFVQIVHEKIASDFATTSSNTLLAIPGGESWVVDGRVQAPPDWPVDDDGVAVADSDGDIPPYASLYANGFILDIAFDEEPCSEGADSVTFSMAVRVGPAGFALERFVDITAGSVIARIVNR